MMSFQIVVLWSDVLIWLLVVAGIGVGVLVREQSAAAARPGGGSGATGPAWRRRRCCSPSSLIGLLDSLHYRLQLDGKPGQKASYAVEVLSVLDALAAPLRTRNEKTYSEPLATRALRQGNHRPAGRRSYGARLPAPEVRRRHLGEREGDVSADAGV